jgi:hypothetical protein
MILTTGKLVPSKDVKKYVSVRECLSSGNADAAINNVWQDHIA